MIIYTYSPTGTQRNTREHQSAPLSPTQIHITISELKIISSFIYNAPLPVLKTTFKHSTATQQSPFPSARYLQLRGPHQQLHAKLGVDFTAAGQGGLELAVGQDADVAAPLLHGLQQHKVLHHAQLPFGLHAVHHSWRLEKTKTKKLLTHGSWIK